MGTIMMSFQTAFGVCRQALHPFSGLARSDGPSASVGGKPWRSRGAPSPDYRNRPHLSHIIGGGMEAVPVQRKVAQMLSGSRNYLHFYECPDCGKITAKLPCTAKRSTRCRPCAAKSHGMSKTPIYRTWLKMKERCTYEKHPYYHNYGGRGISICNEWMSFEAFACWASANGWRKGLELDRIDNDLGYMPSNCRFVTKHENAQNTRANKISADDVAEIRRLRDTGMTGAEIARRFGVTHSWVFRILNGKAWQNVTGLESALHSPQGG